ncbi:sphinganine C4-monooxygenase [Entomortierella parvispora]|uniref:Sphinganine C4-monooxygenase n=1 Tax=Entomortierella parvispora TaxID=205924 RepID=A0A9P3M149_9FUNG|nr:sphinganine C4-monooxygenase [Entomortierella parvispora]
MAPTVQAPLFSFISDQSLALLLPVIVYWAYSLLFHWASLKEFAWMEKYRIHDKEEETRNRVSLPDVIKAVIVQQVLQTALGFIVVVADDSEMVFDDELSLARYQQWINLGVTAAGLQGVVSQTIIASMAHLCYFYLESIVRFWVAMAVLDTWQYFLHRLFHNVPYLYKTFHSRHHRLYVTYSFGALYNHPFEGFLMDSVGASLAFLISGMGNRGALAFFSFSTLKTVDDHCGYNLPFNPLQRLFWNNADYHDIHHQNFGIKSNFSQPFGTIWDHVLGTHMSREEANQIIKIKEERKAARLAAQNHGSNTKTTLTTGAIAVGSSIKTSDPYKEEDVHSSGNNSGNDSHEETEEEKNSSSARRPSSVGFDGSFTANATSSSVELPGYRELLATRVRVDNGFVSGKGQGKAL